MTSSDASEAEAYRARAFHIVTRGLPQMAAVRDAHQRAQSAITELEEYAGVGRHSHPVSLQSRIDLAGLLARLARASDRAKPTRRRSKWQFLDWLGGTVGSGHPRIHDPRQQSAVYRNTMLLRFLGAALATTLVGLGLPSTALVCLLTSVIISGFNRYRTNAEAAVSFRARFVSQMLGHLGDALVLSACTWATFGSGLPDFYGGVLLVGTAVSQFAGLVRTGCHEIGIRVGRPRLDRAVRITAIAGALCGVTWRVETLIVVAASLLVLYSAFQTVRLVGMVWRYRAEEVLTVVFDGDSDHAEIHAMRAPAPLVDNRVWRPSRVGAPSGDLEAADE